MLRFPMLFTTRASETAGVTKPCVCLVCTVLLMCPGVVGSSRAEAGTGKLLTRDVGNLEGQWLFRTDPQEVGEQEGWQRPELDDSRWRALKVPGSWEAQGATDPPPGLPPKPKDGVPWSDYDGVGWYRLRFVVPAAWNGEELVLDLGSVDDEDKTYINGRLVGETVRSGGMRSVLVLRRYTVPRGLVNCGDVNVLAVRVFDAGGPGGIMGPTLSLLPAKVIHGMKKLPDADRSLAKRFADPPAASRILKIIHSLPDAPDAQDRLISTLIAQGFGGFVSNVSFADYLASERSWGAFVRAVKQAKRSGMSLWLYDERGYPSGNAGGLTMQGHPEWQARGLLVAEARSPGGPLALDVPPGSLVLAAAFPVQDGDIDLNRRVDLAAQVRDGKLSCELPSGSWRVMAITEDLLFEGTHAALNLAQKMPYVNLLLREPTARFIELTHASYAKRLANDLGRYFASTFTDEPSLMSMFLRPMPYRVLPWGQNLPEEFRRRRGYAIEPLLPALVADAGGVGKKARYDFWQTVGELVAENYFGQIQEWCRRHRIASGGHLLAEESLLAHVPLYGDFFRCARRLDAPSIDCLTSIPAEVPWHIARLLSSVAELEGRSIVMSETSDHAQRYRPAGDNRPARDVTEAEIRGTCNRLMLGGVNTTTSYYSFSGLSTEELRRLNAWVGRSSTMLTGGHQAAEIAVVYPVESIWTRFVPGRSWGTDSPAALQVERTFRLATDSLYAATRDFSYVDSQALAHAKVRRGCLAHGDLRWRVVVLPCVDTLPMAAWENLGRFWRKGGVVIALTELPTNSEKEFPSGPVQALAAEVFGAPEGPRINASASGGAGVFLPAGSESLLPLALDAVLERDIRLPQAQSPIRATHRRIDGHEVFFVINDSGSPWEGDVRLAVSGRGEQWDPATGTMAPVADGQRIGLSLGAYCGAFFRFAKPRPPARLKVSSGPLPGLKLQPLPAVEPTVGKGEFVRGGFAADAANSRADLPAWRTEGTLTKSKVDTFLFVVFNYPQTVDLTGADCLVVESWVPEGQQTPTELLVILRDREGSDYIAGTGRSLAMPGPRQVALPLSQFRLAGWSKDADGRLDLQRVAAVSIGWGGYFGVEGERVVFSLSCPRVARLDR